MSAAQEVLDGIGRTKLTARPGAGGFSHRVEIDCAGCGHRWTGRFKQEEWE